MEPKKDIRMTRQRQVILEQVAESSIHPTADEVFELVRKKLPRISLATVYRNLDVLAEQGRIVRLVTAGSAMRFDARVETHHHLRCLNCGRIDDVKSNRRPRMERLLDDDRGYEITGYRLEFLGRCAECARRGNGSGANGKSQTKANGKGGNHR